MFAQASAATAAPSKTAALPVSVLRNSRSGAGRLRAQAVCPVKAVRTRESAIRGSPLELVLLTGVTAAATPTWEQSHASIVSITWPGPAAVAGQAISTVREPPTRSPRPLGRGDRWGRRCHSHLVYSAERDRVHGLLDLVHD